MTAYISFFASIAIVSASCAWLLGAKEGRFDLQAAFMGCALAPALMAMGLYVSLACLSYVAPSRALFIACPAVASIVLVWFFGRGSVGGFTRGSIGQAVLCGAIWLAASYPVLTLVFLRASQQDVPHDLTTYFMQAIDVNEMMRSGTDGLLGWWKYSSPSVAQPHSLSFSVLLAWGFLFVDNPGAGADHLPKLLVVWSIISLLVACVSVGMLLGAAWGAAAGIILLANVGLVGQVSGLSRDSFYLAPLIVCVAFVAKKLSQDNRSNVGDLAIMALVFVAILLGHTLGIVYAAGLFVASGLVALIRSGNGAFSNPIVLLMAVILACGAAGVGARYFLSDPASIGFEFPYYVDPFQIAFLKTVRPFAVDSSISKLIEYTLSRNGISPYLLVLALAALPLVAVRSIKRQANRADTLWLVLVLTIAACICVVSYMPVKLQGLSLASAFVVNFRYGFGLSILTQLLVLCSVAVLFGSSVEKAGNRPRKFAAGALAIVFAVGWVRHSEANWEYGPWHNEAAIQRMAACTVAMNSQPRRVLIDDVNMTYICKVDALNVYSQKGILISGIDGDENIRKALDAQDIDAVVLYTSPRFWSGTRLYQYLEKYWQKSYSLPNRVEVFLKVRSQ